MVVSRIRHFEVAVSGLFGGLTRGSVPETAFPIISRPACPNQTRKCNKIFWDSMWCRSETPCFLSSLFSSAFNGAALTTRAKASSAMKMSFEDELGAQAPLGFWDPLYWLENADQERFDRLRYLEIKHGRISMLAVLGHIVQVKTKRACCVPRFCDNRPLILVDGDHSVP